MKKNILAIFCCHTILLSTAQVAAPVALPKENPLATAKSIGDKLIRETPFKYQLNLLSHNKFFNGVQAIDFGRVYGSGKPAVGYAYTQLTSNVDIDLEVQLEHNDGCKLWLNNELVYQKTGARKINITMEERSYKFSNVCRFRLKKGINDLLVKAETFGNGDWKFYMQPPATNGAILSKQLEYPSIGLGNVQYMDKAIANITNWLIIGPFKNENRNGINNVYPPENKIAFGVMYPGSEGLVTWTIPKVEILGTMIGAKKWGTSYNWNYHNGGTAWALQKLSELTGEKRYDQYATDFCEFHLDGIPFVEYQVKGLNADSSANKEILGVPLLDFTTAPSLPLIHKLVRDSAFPKRDAYKQFVDKVVKYAAEEQLRLPVSNIYTRLSPEKYTTWVDDMFMGIPFLVQAALYADEPSKAKRFFDDASSQVIGFNGQVWDSAAHLYSHAKYSTRPTLKLPHWSRANGWGIWATTEVLLHLPKNHPNYKAVLKHYKEHVEAIVKYQNERGFWYNVIDNVNSKDEVSGTAIFTMAIARGINNGWLPAPVYAPKVFKAWEAIKTRIDADGTVHDICMGTMCSEDVNYYINRPYFDNDTHGLFAVLFAAMEVSETVKKLGTKSGMSAK